jgi:hypothetical protein
MIVILVIVAGFFIIRAFSFKNEVLERQVDAYGGMNNKYSLLVKAFSSDPRSQISKVSRDEIVVFTPGDFGVSTTYRIKEAPNTTHVFWECDWQHLGKHEHKWVFPDTLSQQVMLGEIENFMKERFS